MHDNEMFGSKINEITGKYTKLHNGEFHYLYSPIIVWVIEL